MNKKPKIITEEISEEGIKEEEVKAEVVEKAPEVVSDTSNEKPLVDTSENKGTIASFRDLDVKDQNPIDTKGSDTELKEAKTVESPKSIIDTPETTNESGVSANGTDMSSDDVKKWLSDVRPDVTKEMDKGKGPIGKILMILFILLLIGGLIAGGVFYYRKTMDKGSGGGVAIPTPTEGVSETTPTPTASVSADLSEYKINILNGSGIAGEAGKVSALLEKSGFSKASTGNADSYNYTTTVISVKEDFSSEIYNKIKESLEKTYIIEKSEDPLDDKSSYDIVITVGSKKAS